MGPCRCFQLGLMRPWSDKTWRSKGRTRYDESEESPAPCQLGLLYGLEAGGRKKKKKLLLLTVEIWKEFEPFLCQHHNKHWPRAIPSLQRHGAGALKQEATGRQRFRNSPVTSHSWALCTAFGCSAWRGFCPSINCTAACRNRRWRWKKELKSFHPAERVQVLLSLL